MGTKVVQVRYADTYGIIWHREKSSLRALVQLRDPSQGTYLNEMTAEQTSGKGGDKNSPKRQAEKPDWSDGLRQLYDSVLDEDLPDSFKDLLSKLDEKD